mmetsp:Transcript_118832/g.296326  ORF Transcript_118832/g.296326 Transcript_118832/m.296326 type:complete len:228 (-) Transcript_118832:822-1505(-)
MPRRRPLVLGVPTREPCFRAAPARGGTLWNSGLDLADADSKVPCGSVGCLRSGVSERHVLLCDLRAVRPVRSESVRLGLLAHRLCCLHRCTHAYLHKRLADRSLAADDGSDRQRGMWDGHHGVGRARLGLCSQLCAVVARHVVCIHGPGDRRVKHCRSHIAPGDGRESRGSHVNAADGTGNGSRGWSSLARKFVRHRPAPPFRDSSVVHRLGCARLAEPQDCVPAQA